MGFKEDIAAAREVEVKTTDIDVLLGENVYTVVVSQLPGMQWADIMAQAPSGARVGYDTNRGALLACKRHGKLLDADRNEVEDVDWGELFDSLSGVEVAAIAATWWGLNVGVPNDRVVAAKKALAARTVTS